MSGAYEGGAGTAGKQTRSFPKVNSAARRNDGACQNPWKPGQRRTRSESKPPVRLKALKGKNAGNLRPCRLLEAGRGSSRAGSSAPTPAHIFLGSRFRVDRRGGGKGSFGLLTTETTGCRGGERGIEGVDAEPPASSLLRAFPSSRLVTARSHRGRGRIDGSSQEQPR
jgi:hypothetical protein